MAGPGTPESLAPDGPHGAGRGLPERCCESLRLWTPRAALFLGAESQKSDRSTKERRHAFSFKPCEVVELPRLVRLSAGVQMVTQTPEPTPQSWAPPSYRLGVFTPLLGRCSAGCRSTDSPAGTRAGFLPVGEGLGWCLCVSISGPWSDPPQRLTILLRDLWAADWPGEARVAFPSGSAPAGGELSSVDLAFLRRGFLVKTAGGPWESRVCGCLGGRGRGRWEEA